MAKNPCKACAGDVEEWCGPDCTEAPPNPAGEKAACRGCGKPLDPANLRVADGCPCNTPRGVNHGLVPVKTCTCTECDPEQTGSTRYESTSEVCASLESEFNAMPTAEQDRRLGNLLTEIYKPPHPADELAEAAVATPAPPEDVVERLRIEEGFARDRSANILARLLAEAAAAIESLREHLSERTRERDEAMNDCGQLRTRAEAAEKDSERINRLEAHLKHNRIWKDTVLMHDYEDGVWLAHAPRGTLLGCLPLEHKSPHKGLREAIDAALPSPVPESGKGEGL